MDNSKVFKIDEHSLLPLLSLVPRVGSWSKLPELTSSLYARYEKVKDDNESAAEEQMLKEIIDWIKNRSSN